MWVFNRRPNGDFFISSFIYLLVELQIHPVLKNSLINNRRDVISIQFDSYTHRRKPQPLLCMARRSLLVNADTWRWLYQNYSKLFYYVWVCRWVSLRLLFYLYTDARYIYFYDAKLKCSTIIKLTLKRSTTQHIAHKTEKSVVSTLFVR